MKRKLSFLLFFFATLPAWANFVWIEPIRVTVRGQGPDVMLIPGLASSVAVWDATAAQLQGHYRLHLVQVAGFGGAPPWGKASSNVAQPVVDALDRYIKTNQLKQLRAIGHSMGGMMGMMLALQHPEDCSKLMIVDALPFFSVLLGATNTASAQPQAAAMRDTILTESQEAYAEGQKEFFPTLVKSPEGLSNAVKWAIASDKSVVARAIYEDTTMDLRPRLHEIKIPVTILCACDAETGFSPEAVDALYQKNYAPLPNKSFVRIDDSRHFIMLDQPAAFITQVKVFLK